VNGRIAASPADFSVVTARWLLTLVVYGPDRLRSVPPYTGRVPEPERIARRGLRRSAYPAYTRPQAPPAALGGAAPELRLGADWTVDELSRDEHLRVLSANECKDRLALVAPIVANLGHEVIAREIDVKAVGAVTAGERPDVALVGLGRSSEHALALIDKIVKEASCPVILLLHTPDPAFVKEASKRRIFAYITDAEVDDLAERDRDRTA
jgi:hypothetical protein